MLAHELETCGHRDDERVGDTGVKSHCLQSGDEASHACDPFFSINDALVYADKLCIMNVV